MSCAPAATGATKSTSSPSSMGSALHFHIAAYYSVVGAHPGGPAQPACCKIQWRQLLYFSCCWSSLDVMAGLGNTCGTVRV